MPQLRDPVMVVALSGWVDAGLAGGGAIAFLAGAARDAARRSAASTSPTSWTCSRPVPTVHLVDGVSREIDWPEITLTAGNLGRDVVLCTGPEPSLRWREVLGELVDAAPTCSASREAFTVGGIPAMASHRRPVDVLATGTDERLLAEPGRGARTTPGPPARRACSR